MHFELVVPGLLSPVPVPAPRLPALEMLAARGRSQRGEALPLERWLAAAFGVEATPLPAGALTLLGVGRDPGSETWMRADPIHVAIGADGASVTPGSALDLAESESSALLAALRQHFAADCEWVAAQPARWCMRPSRPMPLQTAAPAGSAADAGDALPRGSTAARARAFVTEVQMLLHRHPVNEAREQRGAPAINSVWLWGAGSLPPRSGGPWHTVLADDPLAAGLARLGGIRHAATPAGFSRCLDRPPADGRVLCVLGEQADLAGLERDWLGPALDALRTDRIGMLTLHAPDAGERWEAARADLRKFWRRARPLRRAP